jgi:CRISPR/Cas system Type II protein with McrA/HNH and RuvC-like nuclease domain
VISTERAFVLIYKNNAKVLENHPQTVGVQNPNLKIYKPSIIAINKFININFHKVKLTRENVFKRDNYECVYCGESNSRLLTLDHVHPKSKGGSDTWENLVTACLKCNNEKSNLTLEEYGKEIPSPKKPHYLMLLKTLTYIPEEWKKYLFL